MADSDGGANFGPLAHHIDRFSEFDAKIDSAVDKVRNPALDHMFYALSSAADHSVIWHVVGGLKSVRAGSLAPARRLSTRQSTILGSLPTSRPRSRHCSPKPTV